MMVKRYVVALAILMLGLSLGGLTVWRPRPESVDPTATPLLTALYAAPVERVETHVLERGQTLSDVLERAAFSGSELAVLLLDVRQHLDPRRLARGVQITVRRWTADDSPRAIDVRVNPDTIVRLTRHEIGWTGGVVLTPVELDTLDALGVIEAGRTLYDAVLADDRSPLTPAERVKLVYALAEIYEFKLDFTRDIQPGDAYRLVFEREARPDGTARSRRILVAELVSAGRTYDAVWFDANEEVRGYYDKEGRPLRTGFSRYPVAYPRITSNFSSNRYHPILRLRRAHTGTDFGARQGTEVYATADGTVIAAARSGGYGNLIRVRHRSGYETRYAHLSRFARGIRPGARVSQKQVIGYVGATGLATAPHLHYELRKAGRAINARTAKLPDAPPLPDSHLDPFRRLARDRFALLEGRTATRFAALRPAPSRDAENL